ncbi:LamG-like jellyroll fold domain-containing protein [Nocardioides sp.]|uniref:LamG-like jellyroll fold domain-containing protein n=1 Tax=Nocardioides sp. TaxID=35761 RepID=UPI00345739F0
MTTPPLRNWRRRSTALLASLSLTAGTLAGLSAGIDGASAATPAAPALTRTSLAALSAPVLPTGKTWPASVRQADVFDANFATASATDTVSGNTATVARSSGTTSPAYVADATLDQQVAAFDGTNGFAFATDAWKTTSTLVSGNAITMECVFKLDSSVAATHSSYPCSQIYSGGAGFVTSTYAAGAATATLSGRVGFPSYTDVSTSIKTDTWYHAVTVWDGENVALYVNGALAAMANMAGKQFTAPTYNFFTVGGAAKSATALNTSSLNGLYGSVASSRVWSKPLTEAEISALYTFSGVPSSDTGTGTTATSVPKADVLDVDLLHGDTTNHADGSSPSVFGAPTKTWQSAIKHTGVTFNGSKDALSYDFSSFWNPANTPNLTTGFTVECYFKLNATSSATQKTCSGEQTGGVSIQIPASSNSTVKAEAYIAGGYKALTVPITAGAFNHVVFTYNGAGQKVYVNGVLKGFSKITGRVSPPGGLGFNLGADIAGSYPTAESFTAATIATSRIWSSALSDEQVKLLYKQDTTTATAPKADVLDVDFSGNNALDASANQLVPEEYGTPQIVTDPTLKRQVSTFAGDGSAQVYDITPMWDATAPLNIVHGFTIQCDFRYDGTLPASSESNVCSGKQAGGYSLNVSGNSVRIRTCVGTGGTTCITLSSPIKAGIWYAAVATWDSTTGDYRLYLNGKLVGIGTASGTGDDPEANPKAWAVGADINSLGQPEASAPVTIAEARMWGHAITADEVAALYSADLADAATDVALLSTSPAAGDTLTKAAELKVKVRNKEQAFGWAYAIDGVAVQPGSTIGAGFAAGAHVLTITATDSFGLPISYTVPFTSAAIPAATAAGTDQGSGKVTLSAVGTSPTGGKVTTTFKVAEASVADGGETGTIASIPSTLAFSSTATKPLSGAQAFDGTTVASLKSHDQLPYQKFDVAVPAGDVRHVRWAGTVDPARALTLYAWDTSELAWKQLATARGNAAGLTQLESAVVDSMVDTTVSVAAPSVGVVHVLAVASDPFADDLTPRDGSNAGEKFADPSAYDFAFTHWTDPQYVAEGAAGGSGYYPASPTYTTVKGANVERSTAAEQKVWKSAYDQAAEWSVTNAEQRKIVWASNTGDIINNNHSDPASAEAMAKYGAAAGGTVNKSGQAYSEVKDQIDRENTVAKNAFEKVWSWRGTDGKGLPSQVVAGNHDNRGGTDTVTSATDPTNGAAQDTTADNFYNDTFTAASYYAQAQQWPAGASYHTIDETVAPDGTITPGTDNQNNYVLFSAGGQDFVSVGLSYGVTKAEADWASSIFARYADRNGILITHAYLGASTNVDGRGANKSGDGSRLFTKVVTANPNVFLVLAGHVHGVGTNLLQVKNSTATVTHKTVELLADYQNYQAPASKIFTYERCTAAGLSDVYNPTTKAGTKCKPLGDGTIDVDGDGTADHRDTDLMWFGASFLRLLQFNLKDSTMRVESYSPFLDEFGAHQYDEPGKRYNGSEDAFTVPVDLKTRTTSFATDGLAVLTPGAEVIGTASAASGLPATVTWSGLTAGQTYAWAATSVADGEQGSADQFGGLFVATAAGTDVTAPVLTVPAAATLTVGDTFDPRSGAKALDDTDGDLTAKITVTGSVDTSKAGSYALIYAVADTNGNTAQGTRVVTVTAAAEVAKKPTTVTVANAAVTFGKESTLTATVSPSTLAGTVVFNNGEDPICQAVVSGGKASCVTSNFGGGSGQYVGDATFYPDDTAYDVSNKAFVLSISAPATTKPPTTAPALSLGTPVISGKVKVGKRVSVSVAATKGATLRYQWRIGKRVVGTGSTLKLTKAMRGKRVQVRVTATYAGHQPASITKVSGAKRVTK